MRGTLPGVDDRVVGLPSAAICMWGSALANAALFALVYPAVRSILYSLHQKLSFSLSVHHFGHARTARPSRPVQPVTPSHKPDRQRDYSPSFSFGAHTFAYLRSGDVVE